MSDIWIAKECNRNVPFVCETTVVRSYSKDLNVKDTYFSHNLSYHPSTTYYNHSPVWLLHLAQTLPVTECPVITCPTTNVPSLNCPNELSHFGNQCFTALNIIISHFHNAVLVCHSIDGEMSSIHITFKRTLLSQA
ncbi:hypothetical protein L596_010525 [Steinernema carpocapsae]|uniref:C-type lectin domain-containing protein n=1 Tax=Steinernema carpocapsae TaxID=34508 RepID=A0A4U5PIW4_STECR|nr:hypothetical protein L596_010525 [Steinernema carpocapsae]